jgi:hypothetical protein
MGWSGGEYTRARDFTDDEANGIKMLAANFDEEHDSVEAGINNCLTKDGQNSPSANLPMSAKRHTGCGDGVARNDYASFGQVQDGKAKAATTGGATDVYTLALAPTLTAYADGQVFVFKAHASCTGAATLNVDDLGAVTIQQNLTNLEADDITVARTYMVVYYGSLFHLFSQVPAASTPQYKIVREYIYSNATWTCPVGVTQVLVQCWAGGGGAGNVYAGQGGSYAESEITATPEEDYDIVIGAAGNAGSDVLSGTAGGDTKFDNTVVVAKGGAPNGGGTQSGCVGDFVSYGGSGLQYTKDMETDIEGYFGGWPFGGTPARQLFLDGAVPGGGGAAQLLPTTAWKAGAKGMMLITYVELV